MLNIKDVSIKLGSKEILSDVSFELKRGEIAILKGKSGSGKSTLLKAIAGLITHNSGSITLENHEEFGSKIGYVFQDYQLFPHFDTLANVALPLTITQKISKNEAIKRSILWLKKFGLEEHCNQSILTLSGGQKQRVAIARALVFTPSVLLLDEPSSALDAVNSAQLALFLNELASNGITILIASHDQHFISKLNFRVLPLFGEN